MSKLNFHFRFRSRWIGRLLIYLFLIDVAFVFIFPFFHMIVTSLKSPDDIRDITVGYVLNTLHWDNYKFAWDNMGMPTTMFNSIITTAVATLGHVLSCSFVAYGFARYKFPLKNLLFFIVILTIIIPSQTLMVPQYIINSRLELVNHPLYLAILLPTFVGFGLRGGLFIFIFYSFFQSVPRALEEAATIDGCGAIRTFFRIIAPTANASFLVTSVLSFVWHWNDATDPNIYISTQRRFLLPQMLPAMVEMMRRNDTDQMSPEFEFIKLMFTEATIMAGATIAMLPLMIAYFFVQSRFMESVERTGITGE